MCDTITALIWTKRVNFTDNLIANHKTLEEKNMFSTDFMQQAVSRRIENKLFWQP